MKHLYSIYFIIIAFSITICTCANILAILPIASPSHGIWDNAILEGLASKGHKITALAANPKESKNNITYINIENSFEEVNSDDVLSFTKLNTFQMIDFLDGWLSIMCDKQLKSKGFKTVLNMNTKFDVILFESLGNECFYGFLEKFKAPTVAINAYGCYSWGCTALGGYYPLSVYPDQMLSYTEGHMTFWQRIWNIIAIWYSNIKRYFIYRPMHHKRVQSYIGENIPPLDEIEDKYFKLMLINSGPAGVDANVVLSPAVVEVGCVQCRPAKPLPQDIQEFLDSAKNGAIYFSLGSFLRSSNLNPQVLNEILKTFAKLPFKILWKFESDLPNKPDNVKISKWLPQQDILAHPNVKLFVSHGGKLSSQESIYHGVPVLALPLIADQYSNAQRNKNLGFGEYILLKDITDRHFAQLISKLFSDIRYTNKAKEASILMQDQPQTPLERAIFWIEYVIRHGHKTNLKASTTKLPWYQLLYLDIIAFVLFICYAIKFTARKIFKSKNNSTNKKIKTK